MAVKKVNKISRTIPLATAICIFSLLACFTGVYAWFSSNQSVTVSGATFTVITPQALQYELYYLDSFTDNLSRTRDGNYNSVTNNFSGYELDYEDATFEEIVYNEGVMVNDPDPTNITELWPAHKLTFAFVIPSGTVSKLSLTDWSETESTALNDSGDNICLSWAINMYGAAKSVEDTGDTAADVATGYVDYFDDTNTDVFDYSEDDPAPDPREEVVITNTIPANADGYRTIIYFTVEFSNDVSTFYKYDSENDYYVHYTSGSTVGFNSNCYIGASLTSLEFTIG